MRSNHICKHKFTHLQDKGRYSKHSQQHSSCAYCTCMQTLCMHAASQHHSMTAWGRPTVPACQAYAKPTGLMRPKQAGAPAPRVTAEADTESHVVRRQCRVVTFWQQQQPGVQSLLPERTATPPLAAPAGPAATALRTCTPSTNKINNNSSDNTSIKITRIVTMLIECHSHNDNFCFPA